MHKIKSTKLKYQFNRKRSEVNSIVLSFRTSLSNFKNSVWTDSEVCQEKVHIFFSIASHKTDASIKLGKMVCRDVSIESHEINGDLWYAANLIYFGRHHFVILIEIDFLIGIEIFLSVHHWTLISHASDG